MISVSCPSCGNSVSFATKTTAYAVCEACQSLLVRQDVDVEKIGVSAAVQEDGTPLQIGASGKYKGVGFELVGRIQVQYPSGFWNEWFATFLNGQEGWVGEAQGNYFVSFVTQVTNALPPFSNLQRGVNLVLNNHLFVVTQVQQARVVAFQGSLPFAQSGQFDAPVADLRSATNVGATIDYSNDEPMVFIGEYVDFDQLHLQNLREIEGW